MAKNFLIIINDAPYGNERPYNAMRLAFNLVKKNRSTGARLPHGRWCDVRPQGTEDTRWLLQCGTHDQITCPTRKGRHLRFLQ